MLLRPLPLLVLACTLAALWPQVARADVRRCVTAGGQTIFTDRTCSEVDAVERPAHADAPSAAPVVHRAGGCARTLQDLVFEVSSAIETRDANRLAGVYHWPGTSADAGYRIWTRLDVVANRPLVDIVPVMPNRPDAGSENTSNDAGTAAPPQSVDAELYPQTAVRRNPVALRVEQTLDHSATPARTVFGLTHYFGCWWLRF
jgi:hypothetical protein